MARTAATAGGIVSLKVALRGIRPPVWRRLLMPARATLGDLHAAIQAVMGWDDAHLHLFAIADGLYGDPASVDDADDEDRITLDRVTKWGVERFTYTYDFGDDWEHTVAIEGRRPPEPGRSYPACIAGRRACPPEDCGGAWGYQEVLAALADPAHPDRAELVEWIGADFDPEAFSVVAADAALAARFGRR